jgi:predicted Ser/Thr protein kinase
MKLWQYMWNHVHGVTLAGWNRGDSDVTPVAYEQVDLDSVKGNEPSPKLYTLAESFQESSELIHVHFGFRVVYEYARLIIYIPGNIYEYKNGVVWTTSKSTFFAPNVHKARDVTVPCYVCERIPSVYTVHDVTLMPGYNASEDPPFRWKWDKPLILRGNIQSVLDYVDLRKNVLDSVAHFAERVQETSDRKKAMKFSTLVLEYLVGEEYTKVQTPREYKYIVTKNTDWLLVTKIPIGAWSLYDEDGREYKVVERLGSGAYGCVFKVVRGTQRYAAKWCNEDDKDAYWLEKMAQAPDHPGKRYIVKFYAMQRPMNGYRIVFQELCDTTLFAYIQGQKRSREVGKWARQLKSACAFLDAQKILHNDLHAENVMLTYGDIRLIDFGLAESSGFSNVRAAEAMMRTLFEVGKLTLHEMIFLVEVDVLPEWSNPPQSQFSNVLLTNG